MVRSKRTVVEAMSRGAVGVLMSSERVWRAEMRMGDKSDWRSVWIWVKVVIAELGVVVTVEGVLGRAVIDGEVADSIRERVVRIEASTELSRVGLGSRVKVRNRE